MIVHIIGLGQLAKGAASCRQDDKLVPGEIFSCTRDENTAEIKLQCVKARENIIVTR